MKRIIRAPLLFSAVMLTACGGSETDNETSTTVGSAKDPVEQPALSLTTSSYQLITETPFSLSLVNRGGIANSCTVSPKLP